MIAIWKHQVDESRRISNSCKRSVRASFYLIFPPQLIGVFVGWYGQQESNREHDGNMPNAMNIVIILRFRKNQVDYSSSCSQ
jgi:hypothetical protein